MVNEKYYPVIKAALAGGRQLMKFFGKALTLTQKSTSADFRTEADIASENAILKILQKEFPSYNIYTEESGFIDKKSEYTFVIDPLDGTNNFSLGIPYFSVSIALMHKSDIIFSTVNYPFLRNTYYATRDKGAYMDGKRIKVSTEKKIENATVVYACNYGNNQNAYSSKVIKNLNLLKPKRLLNIWSTALDLCLLASGKIEVIINNESEIYDYLAGKLIAKEAGAIITNFDGGKEAKERNNRFLVCNDKLIHKKITEIL